MVWVKLDDQMPDHPKVAPLSDSAFRLHVHGLCYCGRHLTDGFVPAAIARRLIDGDALAEILSAGTWEETDGGYQIHDYLDYQPSRADVEGERRKTADRVARWRARNAVTNSDTNGDGDEESTPAPVPGPVPVPNPNTPLGYLGQLNPKVEGSAELTITKNGTPAAHAADDLLHRLSNATPSTVRRLESFLRRGAVEADFHDAREALRQRGESPDNPAAWACGVIDDRLKARER